MALNLPPLPPSQPPWPQFQVWWQQVVEAIEAHELDQDAVDAQFAAQLALITAAQATATSAASTASTAQTTANTVKRDDKISASWTAPTNLVSATDAGSDVTIAVAAHARKYGDNTSLSIASHNFTGKSYSTVYGIYYDDTTTSDTTPSYQITTDTSIAQNNYAAGRHFVGVVTTPAPGGAPTEGGTSPPGSKAGYEIPA